mgnify:CR=1 FL=1
MEKISNDYRENVRVLDGLLGVGRSCDMVSRDYLIGGRRGCGWWTALAATASLSGWGPSG